MDFVVQKPIASSPSKPLVSVLFICMGNICRSPIAEGVFRHRVEQAGLQALIQIDSAGTHGYHLGARPDPRAQAAAARRRYDLSALRARQVTQQDMEAFDYVLAMDHDNLAYLYGLGHPDHRGKPRLFLDFATDIDSREVPDPYYGPEEGFELVLDLAENASSGLLAHIRQQLDTLRLDSR
jgi:protein-tyrosine phosphatase